MAIKLGGEGIRPNGLAISRRFFLRLPILFIVIKVFLVHVLVHVVALQRITFTSKTSASHTPFDDLGPFGSNTKWILNPFVHGRFSLSIINGGGGRCTPPP